MTWTPPAKYCLLVVDDEQDICDSVYHLLRRTYDVVRATSAAEGVKAMSEREVHVVMTDQRMPEVSGVEMLKEVRVQYPEAIRLLFTGYADVRSIIDAINQGHVFRYLDKPFSPEELELAVAQGVAEYARIARREHALTSCVCKVEVLERDLTELRERLALLESVASRVTAVPEG